MASEGLNETRRAVHALRAGTLPLRDELARAAAEVAGRHHIHVECRTSGTPLPLPPDAAVALVRIAQEALVNAVKHAPGADIAVDLDYREDGVRLTVTNPLPADAPGVTGSAATGSAATGIRATELQTAGLHTLDSGYGLTGMRERLLLLRGSLAAGQRDGQWAVTADIPLTPASVTEEEAGR